eukprot:GDKK01002517.1.p2 GENE.GDKK01002517.1~~GDKK01002517.1.p2  ORF type:complete len:124 (-),score=33.57 GDKK01002517.1:260-631(-)
MSRMRMVLKKYIPLPKRTTSQILVKIVFQRRRGVTGERLEDPLLKGIEKEIEIERENVFLPHHDATDHEATTTNRILLILPLLKLKTEEEVVRDPISNQRDGGVLEEMRKIPLHLRDEDSFLQ